MKTIIILSLLFLVGCMVQKREYIVKDDMWYRQQLKKLVIESIDGNGFLNEKKLTPLIRARIPQRLDVSVRISNDRVYYCLNEYEDTLVIVVKK